MEPPTIKDFEALDFKVATVLACELNDGARDPAYKLWLDAGGGEEVQSSAKLTDRYSPSELVGRQVVVAAGFAPMRVGGFRSDVLVLGVDTPEGVILLSVDGSVGAGEPIS